MGAALRHGPRSVSTHSRHQAANGRARKDAGAIYRQRTRGSVRHPVAAIRRGPCAFKAARRRRPRAGRDQAVHHERREVRRRKRDRASRKQSCRSRAAHAEARARGERAHRCHPHTAGGERHRSRLTQSALSAQAARRRAHRHADVSHRVRRDLGLLREPRAHPVHADSRRGATQRGPVELQRAHPAARSRRRLGIRAHPRQRHHRQTARVGIRRRHAHRDQGRCRVGDQETVRTHQRDLSAGAARGRRSAHRSRESWGRRAFLRWIRREAACHRRCKEAR